MSSSQDFLILANRDYEACLLGEKEFPEEFAVALATYHLQQAVEKALKGLILAYGEEPEYTHNIAKLIAHGKKLGLNIPQNLDMLADTLTLWESLHGYDTFIHFSQTTYSMAKDCFVILRQALENEIEETIEL